MENILNLIGFSKAGFIGGTEFGILIMLVICAIIMIFKRTRLETAAGEQKKIEDENILKELRDEIARLKAGVSTGFSDGAVYSLTLLQRGGRLVDFLKEDISQYQDAQVGSAARQIHAGCAKALNDNFSVEPVFGSAREGGELTLGKDFNPAEVRITGNIPSTPPYKGRLMHKGWKASKVNLPEMTNSTGRNVICPAEVEF